MKPMLAADCEGNTSLLRFPLMASPKLDGIRAISTGEMLVSRSLKPIRNRFIQQKLAGLPPGLDGELIVGPPTHPEVFRRSTSGVSSQDGEPDFCFYVFDRQPSIGFGREELVLGAGILPFSLRYTWLQGNLPKNKYVKLLTHVLINGEAKLLEFERDCLELGYEGVMVRSPHGPYKEGRATLREGWLTKVKRFCDAEAVCVGYQEFLHNENEAKRNALGHLERSSHKANKRAGGKLGALTLLHPESGLEFEVGTGFTDAERLALWAIRDTLVGRAVKYKFFPSGSKERPRFPTWLGFRDKEDV